MAKKYLEVFRDSAESQYATGTLPLMGLAALKKGVKFVPFSAEGSEISNSNSQVAIQRMKRAKASDSLQDATKGSGANLVARLDAAQKVEWDTVETKVGTKRDLIISVEPNESEDVLEDASAYERVISNKTSNRLFEAEELATAKVFAAGTAVATKFKLDGTDDDAFVKAVSDKVTELELLVDDFKAYSNGVVVLVHPQAAKAFGRVQGQAYELGTNTFPEGMGKGFRYDGIDYFVSPILNTVQGAAATETAAAIVMDAEAYANAGADFLVSTFDQMYLDERIVGHSYKDLDAVIDAARIGTFEFTKTAGKKVNA